jgi:hypothetical protein
VKNLRLRVKQKAPVDTMYTAGLPSQDHFDKVPDGLDYDEK